MLAPIGDGHSVPARGGTLIRRTSIPLQTITGIFVLYSALCSVSDLLQLSYQTPFSRQVGAPQLCFSLTSIGGTVHQDCEIYEGIDLAQHLKYLSQFMVDVVYSHGALMLNCSPTAFGLTRSRPVIMSCFTL